MTQPTTATRVTKRRYRDVDCLGCRRAAGGICPHHLQEYDAAQADKLRAAFYAVGWCFLIGFLVLLARRC